jgi:DNA repair exonuclease SbcCD nuclease subunit
MNFLFVGDPHAKVSNLDEMSKLINFVANQSNKEKYDFVVLAGDLFNDHSLVRLEVALFWKSAIEQLRTSFKKVIILVGNHDLAGSKQMETQLSSIHLVSKDDSSVMVIDKPTNYMDIAFIPYMSSEEDFIKATEELWENGCHNLLICHQTFNGAKYDNGFFAPGGFDLEKIKQGKIISGHIHTFQEFDKIVYPGTARWDTRSDANQEKGIWDINITDQAFSKKMISTRDVVTPIIEIVIKEGDSFPEIPTNGKIYIELIGKSEWINKTKEKYRGVASIKTTHKDTKLKLGSMSKGLSVEEYIDNYFETTLVSKQVLKEAVKSL